MGNALFVSDSGGDRIYRVAPADFLAVRGNPSVTVFVEGRSLGPNGLFPALDGSLLVVGRGNGGGIYSVDADGNVKVLAKGLGRLDGVAQLDDGTLLITDWKSRSLFRWGPKTGVKSLATGFRGPADFCIIPDATGLLVVVPDLVKSELRMIRLQF
jgi:sugar lactone lactonase YvrE